MSEGSRLLGDVRHLKTHEIRPRQAYDTCGLRGGHTPVSLLRV